MSVCRSLGFLRCTPGVWWVRGPSLAGRTEEVFNGLLVSAGDSEDLPWVWVWRKYVKVLSQGWMSLKSRESRSRVGEATWQVHLRWSNNKPCKASPQKRSKVVERWRLQRWAELGMMPLPARARLLSCSPEVGLFCWLQLRKWKEKVFCVQASSCMSKHSIYAGLTWMCQCCWGAAWPPSSLRAELCIQAVFHTAATRQLWVVWMSCKKEIKGSVSPATG